MKKTRPDPTAIEVTGHRAWGTRTRKKAGPSSSPAQNQRRQRPRDLARMLPCHCGAVPAGAAGSTSAVPTSPATKTQGQGWCCSLSPSAA